jgi:FkbM family methyltransferase
MAEENPDGPSAGAVSTADDDLNPEIDYVKRQFNLLLYRLGRIPGAEGAKLRGRFALALTSQPFTMETRYGPLSFVSIGKGPAARAGSMLTKQPSTIEWIDRFRPDSVFWDIGANVGVYSLYAARRGDVQVVAFEPAAVNYFVLSANCEINGLDDRVSCLQVGLGRVKSVARLEVSQLDPGQSFSFKGKRARPYPGRQSALMLSIDQLVDEFGLTPPNYIKLDVPGVTEQILTGGARVLRSPAVRELHVECNMETGGGRRVAEKLADHGFGPAAADSHGGSGDVTFMRSHAAR